MLAVGPAAFSSSHMTRVGGGLDFWVIGLASLGGDGQSRIGPVITNFLKDKTSNHVK